jgi:hypothetical protein
MRNHKIYNVDFKNLKANHYAALLGVALVIFLSQIGTISSGWSSDDSVFLKLVPSLEFSHVVRYVDPAWGWYYRPSFLIYFGLLRRIFGDNPAAYHAVSIGLHSLAGVLVCVLAQRLKISAPYAAGLVFAAINYTSETPGWISSVSAILALCGCFGALLAWIGFLETGKKHFYALSVGFCLLALGSKEEAAIIPVALLLLDLWKMPQLPLAQRIIRFAPFVLLTISYGILAFVAHSNAVVFSNAIAPNPNIIFMLGNGALGGALAPWNQLLNWSCLALIVGLAISPKLGDIDSRFIGLWFLISILPVPLVVGSAANGSRFWYLPSAFAAMLLLSLFQKYRHFDGIKETAMAFVAALSVPFLQVFVSRTETDLWVASLLSFTILIAVVLWRIGRINKFVCLELLLVSGASQLDLAIYRINALWDEWSSVAAVLVFAFFSLKNSRSWWPGALTITFLFYLPQITLPVYLCLYLWNSRQNQAEELRASADRASTVLNFS